MVEWINDVPLKSPLAELEKKYGLPLPDDLKKLITAYNKGQPRPNRIPLGNGKSAEFYRLLSFNKGDNLSVFDCFDSEMKARQIFPFAMTENGNYICLKENAVILYNVEHNAEKYLCDSVSVLLGMLTD